MRASSAEFRTDGRFHRQSLIEWWDQSRVAEARILVVGAGALGNEVLKNLALLGAGHVLVYDMDEIETSNLSRSVLFRAGDAGRPKAEVAAARARELYDGTTVVARAENVMLRAGFGVFRWADVVIGCVDNREARVFVNAACAHAGRVWVDGAIEALQGIVRAFDPARGACYECTMNATDRKLLAERRSCAMLAREVAALGRVPSTAVAASWVGALQAQEALKVLHDQPALVGAGMHVDGLWNEVSKVAYPRRADCPGHASGPRVTALDETSDGITLEALLARAERDLGAPAVLEFSRDVVVRLTCPECGASEPGGAPLGGVTERRAACPGCGTHRIVEVASSAEAGGAVDLAATPAALGLPPYDVFVARTDAGAELGYLLAGDADAVLGPLRRAG